MPDLDLACFRDPMRLDPRIPPMFDKCLDAIHIPFINSNSLSFFVQNCLQIGLHPATQKYLDAVAFFEYVQHALHKLTSLNLLNFV